MGNLAAKFIAAFFAVGISSTAVNAADVYAGDGGMKDSAIYAPMSWSGFYIGINGGYGWNADELETVLTSNFGDDGDGDYDNEGGFVGGQIGYNLQNGNFVFGIETDIQASDISGSGSSGGNANLIPIAGRIDFDSELEYFGTVRGRLGFAFDSLLVYATGGFAYGEITHRIASVSGDGPIDVETSDTETGYVVGGGLEKDIGGGLSLKVEYQYIDLGEESVDGIQDRDAQDEGDDAISTDRDNTFHTVRAGLNYRFGGNDEQPLK